MHNSRRSRAPPGVAFDLHFITLLRAIRRQRASCGLGGEPLPQHLGSGSELGRVGSIALQRTSGFALDLPLLGTRAVAIFDLIICLLECRGVSAAVSLERRLRI